MLDVSLDISYDRILNLHKTIFGVPIAKKYPDVPLSDMSEHCVNINSLNRQFH